MQIKHATARGMGYDGPPWTAKDDQPGPIGRRHSATGVVASDGDRLVGCAAIEPYDGAALLRSLAVVPDRRGAGVGTRLVHAVEDLARDRGARSLILLTETAEPWFSGHLALLSG